MGASVLVCGASFDGDPFADITASARVDLVMRGGTVVRSPADP